MNTNRLIRMAINMVMRYGMKRLPKGSASSKNAKSIQRAMKVTRRAGRM